MKLVSVLAAALVALPAAAQQTPPPPSSPPPPPTYTPPPPPAAPRGRPPVFVGARVGMYAPGDDLQFLGVLDFGNGLDLEGFVGVPLNPYVSLVGGIGYYSSETDTIPAGGVSAKLGVSAIPITASVRVGAVVDRVAFYGLAGVGYHMTSLELTLSGAGLGSISEDDDVFGWHLGAGLAVALTPRLSLGAEIRQTFVEANYPFLLEDNDPTTPTKLKLDGLRFGATIAFTL